MRGRYLFFYIARRSARHHHRRGYLKIQHMLPLATLAAIGFGLVVIPLATLIVLGVVLIGVIAVPLLGGHWQ